MERRKYHDLWFGSARRGQDVPRLLAQTAKHEVVALMFWDSAEHAEAGAAAIGPTVAAVVGSTLINQDRTVGEIVTEHVAP